MASSAAAASAKAMKEANEALVKELLLLPLEEQVARIGAIQPPEQMEQVGKRLAQKLLIRAGYRSKTVEEKAAFRASLPPLHQRYIELRLANEAEKAAAATRKSPSGSPPKSPRAGAATRKSPSGSPARSPNAAAAAATAATAATAAEPSELDRRVQAFREGENRMPIKFLYDLTKDEQDLDMYRNYGNGEYPIIIKPKYDDSDEAFIESIMAIENGSLAPEERVRQIQQVREVFLERIQEQIRGYSDTIGDRHTLYSIVQTIMSNINPDVHIEREFPPLDDSSTFGNYMNDREIHTLATLYVKSWNSIKENKLALYKPLLEFVRSIGDKPTLYLESERRKQESARRKQELKKLHGNTRKSQYGLRSKSASANVNAAEKVYQKKQMSILGKQDLTWAQKQNALRILGSERKTYFSLPFTTPLHDKKGYKQHSKECSTDAIMQVLTQGMPWAGIVQERLYNGTAEEFNAMYDKMLGCSSIYPNRENMVDLIQNMQERFKLHYTAGKKVAEEEACVPPFDYSKLGPLLNRKVRKSAELGPAILRKVEDVTAAYHGYSTHASYITYIFKLLLHFFGFNEIHCYMRKTTYPYRVTINLFTEFDIQYKGYKHLAFGLRSNHYRSNDITLHTRPAPDITGHYTAIYKSLGESWVYYDNEVGILPLPKPLIDDILNEIEKTWFIGFIYTTTNSTKILTFYKIPYFNIADVEVLKSKKVEQWIEDKWVEVDFRETISRARISTFDAYYHIISKTSADPGFDRTNLFLDEQWLY